MTAPIPPSPSPEGATPAMAQWFALKAQEPESLLFFRMGDFYELFFGDAEAAATALDIALTTRGQHAGQPIPMCGVPVAAAQAYLARLIRHGYRVAVAEQTQSSPKAGGKPLKGPLSRAVIRVISPGTLTEDELLDAQRPNLLLALASRPGRGDSAAAHVGAAWIDISTGLFETQSLETEALPELLARLDPAEILADDALVPPEFLPRLAPPAAPLRADAAERVVAETFGVPQIGVLGEYATEEILACAAILTYVRRSQAGTIPRLARPTPLGERGTLGLDPATRASLDLLQARDGTTEHTLFAAVDRTVTAAGARLLASWIAGPSTERTLILDRQEAWRWLAAAPPLRAALAGLLRRVPDMERALGRLSAGRGQPRDLAAIRDALLAANACVDMLRPQCDDHTPKLIRAILGGLFGRADALLAQLEAALAEALPARLDDGGVIAPGFDADLDRYRALRDDSRKHVAALQSRYAAAFGLSNLKIRHHAQLGFVIEVPAAAAARLRDRPEVTLRQGTASLARFSTGELAELDRAILEAGERAATLERQIFNGLVAQTIGIAALPEIARLFALADALQSAAAIAQGGDWCCPDITEDQSFELRACRHPVVEAALDSGARFVPNDCALPPDRRVMLLTGPNMAGKSTFLRQTALAVILAQAGLPVPAEKARIGLVDRLFSRVGAADDLARGRSTFMVEMTETAAILRQAGPRSLVVVDEIGRGTATLDGLAIAWATLESLHSQLGARTIFATHFHELGALTDSMPRLTPYTMAVREWQGKVIFQHEVRPGAARKSWGVHVAQLAGVPPPVVRRAARLLSALERDHAQMRPSLPLFDDTARAEEDETGQERDRAPPPDRLREVVERMDPDAMSPREALQTLYDLKKLLLEQNGPLA
ncbi:DNA mismatch repair protein MutS [Acidomonas methanolica]|uniref:DNA mismatch repair protein MutS n=3 Tax=Acidomonas methanolica TaxID=437 RepID=UPI0011669499|nr:DNA mismatch repair protein MutS [Acidomonas methanolica]GEK97921.1 DNA mismatch repair protein MutS [Acidomonas methanolica NBRC 104435]